jgi:hypothetical protein
MSLDISRLRRADQIIAGGAIALFVFLFFFKWYGVSTNVNSVAGVHIGGSFSRSGWDTFTNSRWIWLLTIIVALGAVVLVAGQRKLDIPVQPSVIVAGLGALSTLLILYRIVHHPTASASFGTYHASAGIKIGIWLGLVAAAVVTYGGYLAMKEEGTSIGDVRDQAMRASGGVTAPPSGGSSPGSEGAPPAPTPVAPPPPTLPPPAASSAPPPPAPPDA